MTRTENSTKNMYTGLINQFLTLILRFITRTVLIKYLGTEFLGINGLFSNILTMLSLADLGIGSALVYALYKPIAENDYERQTIIIKYMQKTYHTIGLIIIGIGIIISPFLSYIIKEKVTIINIYIVFFMYLFQTASTYLFFPSRIEFLGANQKRYIYNNINSIIIILSNIFQIIILIIFRNFYLYLITVILFNVIQEFIIAIKTEKKYPFIKNKINKSLTKEEKKDIFKDCGALMIYRTNYVILTATDNIIISKYIGLVAVGLYSNYLLVTNSITNLLSIFFNSITASIGNLHVYNEKEKEYFIFKITNFITVTLFGISCVGIYVLINNFITIWIGEEYLLSKSFVIIVTINLYIEGLRKLLATYRTSYGLFRQAKIIPIIGAVTNIIISIILVQRIGIFGVLLGTLISNMISFMWYDPLLIYKKVFNKNVFNFYISNILYIILFVGISIICEKICQLITISGLIGFVIEGLICVIVSILIIFIIFNKTKHFEYLKEIVSKILKKEVK